MSLEAFNEAEPGVAAVAAAIRSGAGGPVSGTVSVAGPSARLTEERLGELAPLVQRCAAEIAKLWPLRPRVSPPGATRASHARPHAISVAQ